MLEGRDSEGTRKASSKKEHFSVPTILPTSTVVYIREHVVACINTTQITSSTVRTPLVHGNRTHIHIRTPQTPGYRPSPTSLTFPEPERTGALVSHDSPRSQVPGALSSRARLQLSQCRRTEVRSAIYGRTGELRRKRWKKRDKSHIHVLHTNLHSGQYMYSELHNATLHAYFLRKMLSVAEAGKRSNRAG